MTASAAHHRPRHRYLRTLAGVLLSWGCGRTAPSLVKIFGGSAVPAGQLPAVVAITYSPTGRRPASLACSGTLIGPDVVLTAGHCLLGADGQALGSVVRDTLAVYVGDGDEGWTLPAQYGVKAAMVHPLLHAHPVGDADYGILLLDRPVSDAAPIPLLTELSKVRAALQLESLTAVGFGERADGVAGRKEQVQVRVRSFTSAEAIVGGEGLDACSGDSGGPLLVPVSTGAALLGTISRGVHLACGDGVTVSLSSDAACWLASLPGVHLTTDPDWDRHYACGAFNRIYDDEDLAASAMHLLCATGAANASQRQTMTAVMLALNTSSCVDAARILAASSELNLDYLMLRDLSPLAGLMNLRRLSLQGNRLTNVAALRALPNLRELAVGGNNIRDFSPLDALLKRGLFMAGRRRQLWNYTDTAFLRYCRAARASEAPLAARAALAALLWDAAADDCRTANERLLTRTSLHLSGLQITDLGPLAGLTSLTALDLSANPITDLTPLASLENLRSLDLTGTHPASLAPLAGLLARGLALRGIAR